MPGLSGTKSPALTQSLASLEGGSAPLALLVKLASRVKVSGQGEEGLQLVPKPTWFRSDDTWCSQAVAGCRRGRRKALGLGVADLSLGLDLGSDEQAMSKADD